MTPPKVSFIVPLFNHVEHSKAMLTSLQASLPPGLAHEIILVDDASQDGTRAWLQTLGGPNLWVVLNPVNVGFARANHAGVALATGDVLALVNNDLIFSPGWLAPMLAVLQNPLLGAGVVSNVQTRVADGALDHAGVRVNALGQVTHVQALGRMSELYELRRSSRRWMPMGLTWPLAVPGVTKKRAAPKSVCFPSAPPATAGTPKPNVRVPSRQRRLL